MNVRMISGETEHLLLKALETADNRFTAANLALDQAEAEFRSAQARKAAILAALKCLGWEPDNDD